MRKKVVAAAACIYLLLSIAIGIALIENAMRSTRQPLAPALRTKVTERSEIHRAVLQDVGVRGTAGVELRAWHVAPPRPNGQTVMLFHGLADTRIGVAGFAELFLQHRYSVLMPDARNHGESGGELSTYGLLEAEDVRSWIDWLKAKGNNGCVYGFGESMGAAILLQSLDYEDRFCAVIAESPFADFREAAYDRVGERLHTGPWVGRTLLRPAIESALLYTRLRYGLDFSQASPRNAVAHSTVPVLLIHGADDVVIAPRNSEAIYATRQCQLQLWRVQGAAHGGAWRANPDEFNRRVISWFQQHTAGSLSISGH